MNLYEINNAIQKAFDSAVDPETGEILDENKLSELDSLQMEREQKLENIGLWIKNLEAEETALRTERKSFESREKAAHNKKEALKKYLRAALGGSKFKSKDGKLSVSYRSSQAVVIKDVSQIPDFYRKYTISYNKVGIKEALKAGEVVPGAELKENQSIIIK